MAGQELGLAKPGTPEGLKKAFQMIRPPSEGHQAGLTARDINLRTDAAIALFSLQTEKNNSS